MTLWLEDYIFRPLPPHNYRQHRPTRTISSYLSDLVPMGKVYAVSMEDPRCRCDSPGQEYKGTMHLFKVAMHWLPELKRITRPCVKT